MERRGHSSPCTSPTDAPLCGLSPRVATMSWARKTPGWSSARLLRPVSPPPQLLEKKCSCFSVLPSEAEGLVAGLGSQDRMDLLRLCCVTDTVKHLTTTPLFGLWLFVRISYILVTDTDLQASL